MWDDVSLTASKVRDSSEDEFEASMIYIRGAGKNSRESIQERERERGFKLIESIDEISNPGISSARGAKQLSKD